MPLMSCCRCNQLLIDELVGLNDAEVFIKRSNSD